VGCFFPYIFIVIFTESLCHQVMQLAADKFVQDELVDRLNSINERLNTLRVENDEVKRKLILFLVIYLLWYIKAQM